MLGYEFSYNEGLSSQNEIELDGVRFKRNDETEFRRFVIQNFIKKGNLEPLIDIVTVDSQYNSSSLDEAAKQQDSQSLPKIISRKLITTLG